MTERIIADRINITPLGSDMWQVVVTLPMSVPDERVRTHVFTTVANVLACVSGYLPEVKDGDNV